MKRLLPFCLFTFTVVFLGSSVGRGLPSPILAALLAGLVGVGMMVLLAPRRGPARWFGAIAGMAAVAGSLVAIRLSVAGGTRDSLDAVMGVGLIAVVCLTGARLIASLMPARE